jgi:O-antigen/teichoic acid export membrane protein
LGAFIRQLLMRYALPGMRNRFHWDRQIAGELFNFGKYIFASTMFGFIINHADRAIMGGFIPLSTLGIYTVAMTLAALPFSVAQTLTERVMLPLYRMRPAAASESNRRHIFAVRRLLIAGGLLGNLILAYAGVFLIDLLYDDRYAMAGPMITLICLVYVPRIVFVSSGAILLSQGDSRRFMYYVGTLAAMQTVFLVVGTSLFGVVGAIVSHALAILATSPLRIHYARRYEAWDWKGELAFLTAGLAAAGFACWLHLDEIRKLFS